MFAGTSCLRRLSTVPPPAFAQMGAGRASLVDKTGAIADLLNMAASGDAHRVFFSCPRMFGKSTTLSTAGEMLAAGVLPPGVVPWPGYKAVDTQALFGGLQVHERLLRGDTTLGSLLKHPHFVVQLALGTAQTGAELRSCIIRSIASAAGRAFGPSQATEVASAVNPGEALEILVDAVPSAVPIALLVDEYDAALIQDVIAGRWEAAHGGVESLRSLFMATKSLTAGPRIERCLVTGVAFFARSSLYWGANNFLDATDHPLLCSVLGVSEAEIRASLPTELQRRLASGLGKDKHGANRELADMYIGYFDGSAVPGAVSE